MLFDEQLDHILYHKTTSQNDGETLELSEGATILLLAFGAVVIFYTFRLILHVEREEMKARKGL